MIYTLTPNPALDICGVVDRMVPDEKNYVRQVVHFAGGNGVNVARVLTRLDIPCVATGFLGGSVGEEFRIALNRDQVDHDFVAIEGMSRMSVTITQLKTKCQTRLSFPGPKISSAQALALKQRVEKMGTASILMCGGSLPESYSVGRLIRLFGLARKKEVPVVLDCPSKILKPLLSIGPALIKPNLFEFQELIGKRLRSVEAVSLAALSLTRKVRLVCISSVDGGALLVTRKGTWYGKGKRIKACSTLGAGDSMVAGMLSQLDKARSDQSDWEALAPELLRWGIAAGMATASRPTGYLGQAADIRHYLRNVTIKRIEK